ncbi:hypothetical protein NO1_1820 [Candidatus Termititenax aidoneus]|uniref:Phage protein n=1 Tax=Termititenax aidoneus TaxID=2218524 RepID=A0A388TDY4_TERA1|nr:hypothetical protein NO1_1820 [Candidatus Termititenax aidoneus]
MGNKTQLINAVAQLFRDNIAAEGTLKAIRRVRVGAREELRSEKDFPIINIAHLGGSERLIENPRIKTDNLRLKITLAVIKPDGTNNNDLYFNQEQTGGTLILFEDMLDVLDGLAPPYIFDNQNYDYDITEDGGKVFYDLTVSVQAQRFTEGHRNV